VRDNEPLTRAGAAVDDAPPEQAPEAINDRSPRAIKGVLLVPTTREARVGPDGLVRAPTEPRIAALLLARITQAWRR
jgi:hypothetical protein